MHKIHITIKDHGTDTTILLDGKPLDGVQELVVRAESDMTEPPTITFKMLADIMVDADADRYREYVIDQRTGEELDIQPNAGG